MAVRLSRWAAVRPPLLPPPTRHRSNPPWLHPYCFLLFLLLNAILLSLPVSLANAVTSEPHYGSPTSMVVAGGGRRGERLHHTTTTTVPSCFSESVKRRRVYVGGQEETLTMVTSSQVPQQLMTRLVAVFLKEKLGYYNLTITIVPDTFDPDSVIDAMRATRHLDSATPPEIKIPKAMVNLEVWIPPGYNLDPLNADFETSSFLGSGGRFGWFLPEYLLNASDFIVEHWRAFTHHDSGALRLFNRSREELLNLSSKMKDPRTGKFYCTEEFGCENGMYTPPWCKDRVCAVLFTSKADHEITKFLRDQIETMEAYVKVVWMGPNLNHDFIKDNMNLSGPEGQRSILVFHWWPSVLLEPFEFISVAFPPCIDSSVRVDGKSPYQCKYEMHRFHKFVWKKLKRHARFAYNALHKVKINHTELMDLMHAYNRISDKTKTTLDKVACDWMKNNTKRWENWKPADDLHELRLVGLFPINNSDGNRNKFLAPGNVHAMFMAVNAINNNTTILSGYTIFPIILNGACEPAMVMRQFIEIIQTSSSEGFYNNLIGFVGPACSDTVEPIAGVSKYFNMPIISYGAEGAIFSDQEHYPYFFRTIPENRIFRYVYNNLFQHLEWTRVASFTEDGQRYSEYLTSLHDLLTENNIQMHNIKYPQERENPGMKPYLRQLKERGYFIIIGDFYQDIAREIICDAYHLKMTGKHNYQWFLPHWYSRNWYDTDNIPDGPNKVSCTTEQMREALQGHMSLSYKYFADDDAVMQENKTVAEWYAAYSKLVQNTTTASDYAGFTYDAVWTYALALDNLFKDQNGESYAADLRAANTTRAFMKEIQKLSFNGVSGHISFASGASRLTDIIVWQFQETEYVRIGRYHPGQTRNDTGTLEMNKDGTLKWPSGSKPDDGSNRCPVEGFKNMLNTTCSNALIVLCAICFGGLTFILVMCFFFFKRRYEKKLQQIQERGRPLFEIFDGWEIQRDKVVINRKLGEGAFGTVYGGECLFDSQGWVAVAVKTLKVGSTISEKLDFLSEAEMMKNFNHDNIVGLLGVCTKSEPIYTVMEFMLYGDLKTYLLARRNLVNEKNRNDDDEVSNKRLTSMALDIARGLSYLAELKYVHRDVACRNCLVNANRTVKLADFGMTRPMYENNYYKFNRKGMLPVRWMAPESLTEGVFTTMSDIWSYGVLLYEIVTFGAFPFQGMTNDQVLEHVKAGHTIAIPVGVRPQLDVLLRTCWHPVSVKRPHVLQIIEHLTNHPRLISACLDGPQSSVQIEDTVSLELRIPDKTRKLSLSINHRLPQMASSSSRKRSMSGNMVMNIPPLTTSLSEDGMISAHSNLDALNLNHVMLEENEMGEDPLLPPAQYVSSRYISLAHKELHRDNNKDVKDLKEKESLVSRQQGDYCTTDISRDLWTSVTPV